MPNTNKLVFWSINVTAVVLLILGAIVVTKNMLPPLTMSTQAQPLSKQAEVVPAQPKPASFVVFPGKFVGNFLLGMSKRDALKVAPKPQENSVDRLVYKNQKTGNRLIAHFQKNRLVQIDFTSKDFYTEEGIHPGNFRDARYATLFDMEELPGTSPRLKYSLKTGGLIFYGNSDALSGAVGVVHEGLKPTYAVQPMQMTAPVRSAQITESAQQAERLARLRKRIEGTQAQTPAPVQPVQEVTESDLQKGRLSLNLLEHTTLPNTEGGRLLIRLAKNVQNASTPFDACIALKALHDTVFQRAQLAEQLMNPDMIHFLSLFKKLKMAMCAQVGVSVN